MSSSHEEVGRNKTSGETVIVLAQWEASPTNELWLSWIFYGLQLPDSRKKVKGGEIIQLLSPVAQFSVSWFWHTVNMARQKGFPNVKANKCSLHYKKLQLPFSPFTGYQFPVRSWHCCHGDLLHHTALRWSSSSDTRLLYYQAQWKWHDVRWCGLFRVLHYRGPLNLVLLFTDRPVATANTLPFGANLWLPEMYTHQHILRYSMSNIPEMELKVLLPPTCFWWCLLPIRESSHKKQRHPIYHTCE